MAVIDRGIRPARLVAELAERGQLQPGLEPFTIPVATLRDFVYRERQRRRKRAVQAEPDNARAAIDLIRNELLIAARSEVASVRMLQKTDAPDDDAAAKRRMERLRQAARALREAAAIPDSSQPRPSQGIRPGQRDPAQDGKHAPGGKASDRSLAGAILAAHHGSASTDTAHTHIEPAPGDAPPHRDEARKNEGAGTASDRSSDSDEQRTDGRPGTLGSAEVEALVARAAAAHGYGSGAE